MGDCEGGTFGLLPVLQGAVTAGGVAVGELPGVRGRARLHVHLGQRGGAGPAELALEGAEVLRRDRPGADDADGDVACPVKPAAYAPVKSNAAAICWGVLPVSEALCGPPLPPRT